MPLLYEPVGESEEEEDRRGISSVSEVGVCCNLKLVALDSLATLKSLCVETTRM